MASVVVVSLFFLICHGLLGASHISGFAPSLPGHESTSHAADASAPTTMTNHGGDETTHHGGGNGVAYASVVTAFLALGVLVSVARLFTLVVRGKDSVSSKREGVVFCGRLVPCRALTLPALQVFRL